MGNKKLTSLFKYQKECIDEMFDQTTPEGREQGSYILKIVIQCLYHQRPFRVPFLKIAHEDHIHTPDCAFCPLSLLFSNLEFGMESELDTNNVEDNLKNTFKGNKFQLKDIKDACEAFEKLIKKLNENVEVKTYDITTMEDWKCEECGKEDVPVTYNSRVWYCGGEELLNIIQKFKKSNERLIFEDIVKITSDGERKTCKNSECKSHKKKGELKLGSVCNKYCVNVPFIFCLGINWDQKKTVIKKKKEIKQKKKEMFELLNVMKPVILPEKMFRLYDNNNGIKEKAARLIALITFSGNQYIAYHWDNSAKLWFKVSEREIIPIGPKWKTVANDIIDSNAYPNLMFYELCKRKHDVVVIPKEAFV